MKRQKRLRLLIREVSNCRECYHSMRSGQCRECYLAGQFDKCDFFGPKDKYAFSPPPLPDWCPLPKIENSNKRMLMVEISRCHWCPYYRDKFCLKINKFITKSDTVAWIGLPEWCPLPKITPDSEAK